ncbi:MAG: hypothetical protein ABI837_00240 [Acidobacteriota bacterium]
MSTILASTRTFHWCATSQKMTKRSIVPKRARATSLENVRLSSVVIARSSRMMGSEGN